MSALTAELDALLAAGPVPFDSYMELVLYHPTEGFFTSTVRPGRGGDFLTSPEISADLGALLATAVPPGAAGVTELGCGTGSLSASLVAALSAPKHVLLVDRSPAALAVARDRVRAAGGEVEAHPGLPPRLPPGLVVANELFDNMPVRLARRAGGAWCESVVARRRERLELVDVPAIGAVLGYLERWFPEPPDGLHVEVQLAQRAYLAEILVRLPWGRVLVLDYGDRVASLARRRPEGTLRTYRAHHLAGSPLEAPGECDITVDVHVDPLLAVAREAGWAARVTKQAELLGELGVGALLESLRVEERAAGATLPGLAARSRRLALETLVHPRGLGDFVAILLAKGCSTALTADPGDPGRS